MDAANPACRAIMGIGEEKQATLHNPSDRHAIPSVAIDRPTRYPPTRLFSRPFSPSTGLSDPRILVTGGAGFIGSHIVEALLEIGHAVTVLDDFSSGSRTNLAHLVGDLRVIEGTIQSAADCRWAFQDVMAVSHQAAFGSVPRSIAEPTLYSANNVHGTVNVLAEARRCGVRRVVVASSSSVYGDDPSNVKAEGTVGTLLSPYAASKRACELFAESLAEAADMQVVCLRYFNVFGPRQNPTGPYAAVIPKFIRSIQNQERAEIHGDGHQARDFTYVRNVVDANLRSLHVPLAAGAYIVNVACGESTSVLELHRQLSTLAGSAIPPVHTATRTGDIRNSCASIDRARHVLGYAPLLPLADGLRLTLAWYQQHSGSEVAR